MSIMSCVTLKALTTHYFLNKKNKHFVKTRAEFGFRDSNTR